MESKRTAPRSWHARVEDGIARLCVLELSSHGNSCRENLEEAIRIHIAVDHSDRDAGHHCNLLDLVQGVFVLLAPPSIATFSKLAFRVERCGPERSSPEPGFNWFFRQGAGHVGFEPIVPGRGATRGRLDRRLAIVVHSKSDQ